MALLDVYERKARLTPGLLAVVPVAVAVATLGLKRFPAIAIAGGVVSAAGGAYALSVLVAHCGRKAQGPLWASHGGPPTTRFLRTREAAVSATQRDVWRQAIETVTGITLLTPRQERARPSDADNSIEAAVGQVRSLGQDSRFPLVAAENAHYGFERNTYGFRWYGRGIAAICVVVLAIAFVASMASPNGNLSTSATLAGLGVDALFLVGWLLIPSASRTMAAAERYASQLLQAVVNVARSNGPMGSPRAQKKPHE